MNPRREHLRRRQGVEAIEQDLMLLCFQQPVEHSQIVSGNPQRRERQHGVARRQEGRFAGALDKRGELSLHTLAHGDFERAAATSMSIAWRITNYHTLPSA